MAYISGRTCLAIPGPAVVPERARGVPHGKGAIEAAAAAFAGGK